MSDPSPDTPSEQHTESNKENTTMDNTPNTISIDGTDYLRSRQRDRQGLLVQPGPHRRPPTRLGRRRLLRRGRRQGHRRAGEDHPPLGATKGLGELATGPVSESVLDPAGMVETHRLGVVLTIACDAGAWKAHL